MAKRLASGVDHGEICCGRAGHCRDFPWRRAATLHGRHRRNHLDNPPARREMGYRLDQGDTWDTEWHAVRREVRTVPGGPITAVYRGPAHLDLMMGGTEGTIWNISWDWYPSPDAPTGWQNEWSTIHSRVYARSGNRVALIWNATSTGIITGHIIMASKDGTINDSDYEADSA